MFQEDGETYMLVPKRKSKPPTVNKYTQTEPVNKSKITKQNETSFQSTSGNTSEQSVISFYSGENMETAASTSKKKITSFQIDSSTDGASTGSKESWKLPETIADPVVVVKSP